MAGGQERVLRRRIRSVESTKKITRAMELIAASRIVRAQQAIEAARPYVAKMSEVVEHLSDTPEAASHPLFRDPETVENVAVILLTADRGLAGAYNTSVIRTAERVAAQHRTAGRNVQFVTVGRKGQSYFRYRNQPVLASLIGISDRPRYEDAKKVVAEVMEPFESGELDEVDLVYTRFRSIGSQSVTVRHLVPLVAEESEGSTSRGESSQESSGSGEATPFGASASEFKTDYEYEPEPAEILDRLLPSYMEAVLHAALLDAAASEHAARQRAMKAATDNADELIKNLRRVMNRARQDAITTEIMEIVGGAEALRQVAGGERSDGNDFYEPTAESA